MSRRILIGVFPGEHELLNAVRSARILSLKILNAYTPHPVHGLDAALGLRPSRLPWLCFAAAAVGAVLKLWFEFWTAVVDWPMNIGGKPWNSLPAFVPVTFEVMVLSAGVTTVFAFLAISRLRPGRVAVLPHARITDDRFVLVLEQADAGFDPDRVREMLKAAGAVEVDERLSEEAA